MVDIGAGSCAVQVDVLRRHRDVTRRACAVATPRVFATIHGAAVGDVRECTCDAMRCNLPNYPNQHTSSTGLAKDTAGYIGHNYAGPNYIDHNYVGHNYVGQTITT